MFSIKDSVAIKSASSLVFSLALET